VAKIDINMLVREVESGLSTHPKERIDEARRRLCYYNNDAKHYMADFQNDAEASWDYTKRPHRQVGFSRQAVDVLTEHLYCPGPSRKWDAPAGDEFLERVYRDNRIDAIMRESDRMSTLQDVMAIQVDAGESKFDDKPIKLRPWTAEEFHAWEDPDDRGTIAAVVTIDRYDQQTRYRLWTDDEVRTFITRKVNGTAGGRVAFQVGPAEPNTYRCLPFAFVHYDRPTRDFWQPGIGGLVVNAHNGLEDGFSRLAQAVHKHLYPLPWAKNVPDGFQVVMGQPNLFLRLPKRAMTPGPGGDYRMAPDAEVGYLQANIDVQGMLAYLRGYVDQVLEAIRIPQSAIRMEQVGVASGISLLVEQAPLLTRARSRRGPFGEYEEELARTILRCSGNHYGRQDLVAASKEGVLILGWPVPSVPIPTDDWLQLELLKVQAGLQSRVRIAEQAYGVSRDQAIEILRQVKIDEDEFNAIRPELPQPGVVVDEDEGDKKAGEDDEGKPMEDDR
jgi:hypothetical protein